MLRHWNDEKWLKFLLQAWSKKKKKSHSQLTGDLSDPNHKSKNMINKDNMWKPAYIKSNTFIFLEHVWSRNLFSRNPELQFFRSLSPAAGAATGHLFSICMCSSARVTLLRLHGVPQIVLLSGYHSMNLFLMWPTAWPLFISIEPDSQTGEQNHNILKEFL